MNAWLLQSSLPFGSVRDDLRESIRQLHGSRQYTTMTMQLLPRGKFARGHAFETPGIKLQQRGLTSRETISPALPSGDVAFEWNEEPDETIW
jgi:hypothetical protein